MADELLVPTLLPNGMTLIQDADFMRRLHYGDATVGWVGDPRLGIYHANGRVEVWRSCEDGIDRLIVRSREGMDRLDAGLLRFLAEHDSMSRRQYNVLHEVDSANAKREAEVEAAAKDKLEEAADRLHYGLMKDIGHLEGGSTKRLMTLPKAPWKKDAK